MSSKSKSIIKQIAITLITFGVIFCLTGIFYKVPDREIPWNYEEYVGGDAYNIMIEASIRGGEIAGAETSKTIYTVFGWSLVIAGGVLMRIDKHKKENIQSIE